MSSPKTHVKHTVRAARASDAGAIAKVIIESWRYAYAGIFPQEILDNLSADKFQTGWANHLSKNPIAFVSEQNDEIIGVVDAGPLRNKLSGLESFGEIPCIYLHPQWIGQGLGEKLLNAAVDALQNRGMQSIAIWVLEKNTTGIRFYQKQGLRFSGHTKIHAGSGQTEHLYIREAPKSIFEKPNA